YESDGKTIEVLDLLGGFGAGLLGHHHPELVEIARANLDDCLPSHAQASCRGWAALLCRKLSKMLSASVGGDYVVHLLNSGTEAVEAAVRHCELARRDQFDQALALAESSWLQFDAAIASFSVQERAALVEDWQGAMPPEVADLAIEQWANWALSENRNAAETEPCFLAFESSYHGSGSAASKLSHGKRFRSALSLTGIDVHFVDPYAPSELEAYLQKISLSLWKIRFNGDERWHLQEVKQSRASALFAEVIQGEGGIRVLPVECLSEMAKICRSHSVPWVADEIQTGLGRTGQFLATESVGVRPSMVLLSKILGGGLAKISAMAVQRRFYVEDFSMQHSSTFSEDDPSSKIAIGVLEILERDDFALIQRGAELGDRFSSGLEALKKKWPHVIADVRGKGLMLGIEFAQQSANPSALIRGFDASGSLAAIATGWLLRAERVRLAPALRHPRTLRIQPSLMIDESGIQHALSAIDRFCRFIAQGDALRLTSFLHGQQFPADESQLGSIEPFVAPVRDLSRGTPYAALYHEPRTVLPRVAFMCHFINPSSVKKWDLSLSPLTTKAAGDLLYRMEGWASYYPLYRFRVKSITGQEVDAVLIGWPIMPRTYLKALRSRPLHRRFTADIREALHDASEEGCTVAGFGGFTSILTHACKDVCNDEIRVTSGNSLTVGMAARALEKGCREQALVMGDETAVILGAAGNLGRIQAELIHEKMGQLLLLGTEGSEARLQLVADELMALHPDAPLPRVSTNVDDIHG
ncbi:MAG: aminotransferase class III-fold pyridoxal phosphate-dependent enzyme, partial [Planctomycetes bacterium]|nr:aminotransferase class III-fold pyridoxal phosphate-dependent enzyme [Planctomycetota bacterium]